MPPSPAPSSPLSSVPSSPEILGSMLPEPPFPSTLHAKRKARRSKAHGHRNWKKQRQERPIKTADEIGAHPTPVSRFVPDATAVQASFSLASDAPVASTSYVGLHDDGEEGERHTWLLKELVGPSLLHKFSLIKAVPGTTVSIADAERRVIALVVYPDDAGILKCAAEAAELIQEEGKKASFTSKHVNGRRGDFVALNAGVAHGGGRVKPANIVHKEANKNVFNKLVTSGPFQQLSGYATGVFKTWAPKLYAYCSSQFDRLLSSDSSLVQLFDNSVLASTAFNFGPRTVCLPHIDFGNLPFLWCWIWSLGLYSWKKGGHLILWDLEIVVEFPPGSLAAIPSGYTSGGNFRWVDHGFQSEEAYKASLSAAEAREEKLRKKHRWEMGLSLFSTLDELGLQ
ncbi:MAG: hypothetical protein NXY57DRAFT_966365 [Lentinula lateritia]|nr:MAG: hypothetical protein NXY57DRAFT_966365 [Lentinula lateritia]